MRRLCTESGNPITRGEWRQYVPGRPFTRPCARFPRLGSPLTETSPTGTATPSAPPGVKGPTASAGVTPIDLHRVAWSNASVPGEFCAVSGEITLRNKKAGATSAKWGRVQIREVPGVTYGDLGGATGAIAAVSVFCDNGGGTADSQVAQAYILFGGSQGRPVPVATLTPQQPSANVISVIDKLTIGHGRITAHEIWSRPPDQSCCATGRATTVWTVENGRLVPGTPDITS